MVAGANQPVTVYVKAVPFGLPCGIRVFLTSDVAGAIIKAQSSIVSFAAAWGQQSVAASLVAPAAGTYYVFVAGYISDTQVGVWASGTVNVVLLPFQYSNPYITERGGFLYLTFWITITNPNNVAIDKTFYLWGSVLDMWKNVFIDQIIDQKVGNFPALSSITTPFKEISQAWGNMVEKMWVVDDKGMVSAVVYSPSPPD